MKTQRGFTTEQLSSSVHRRSFLRGAGILALVSPAIATAHGGASPQAERRWSRRHQLSLLAEGVVPLSFVLPPPQIPPPPPDAPPLEARVRVTFPIRRAAPVLAVQVFFVPEGLPVLPLPAVPPLVPTSPTDPVTISYFEIEVDDILLGISPVPGSTAELPSFLLAGKVLSNPVLSPFGDLTGAPAVVSASYRVTSPPTGDAEFIFLGGLVAGNHATVAPAGKGNLQC